MGKYLRFYKKCMDTGELPYEGLCNCLGKDPLLIIIEPTLSELIALNHPIMFWGKENYYGSPIAFTPLRQNIVLLMAAMNNEL